MNPDAATFIRDPDRETIQVMKRSRDLIDMIIPRGGKSLKDALDGSAVPLLPHFDGICHTYVDRAADLKMAEEICYQCEMLAAFSLQFDGEIVGASRGRGEISACRSSRG